MKTYGKYIFHIYQHKLLLAVSFRLLQHVRKVGGSVCSADSLYKNFKKVYHSSEQLVSDISFKQTVSSLFHVKTSSTQANKESCIVYKG